MKSFLIIGLGRFGKALAFKLTELGNEVVTVDKSEEKVAAVADIVTHAIIADIHDENALRSLGPRNFDHTIVAFSDNLQDNILITLMLKEMGSRSVVAKARDELHIKVLQKVGADRIIFPEREIGQRLAKVLSSNSFMDYIEISSECSVVEIESPESWSGKSIRELNIRVKYGVNILAIRKHDSSIIDISFMPDTVIKSGDIIVVMGDNNKINKLGKL